MEFDDFGNEIVIQEFDEIGADERFNIDDEIGGEEAVREVGRGEDEVDLVGRGSLAIVGADRRRCLAVLGALGSGKSSLVELWTQDDSLFPPGVAGVAGAPSELERARRVTRQTVVTTIVAPTSRGTSHLLTIVDTPGHPCFEDEVIAALRLVDGVVLTVDAAEGIVAHTLALVRLAVRAGLPLVLAFTKIDRLVVELKIPAEAALAKLEHMVAMLNRVLADELAAMRPAARPRQPLLDPARGNVIFTSARHSYAWSCASVAALYAKRARREARGAPQHRQVDAWPEAAVARSLWGDVHLADPATGRIDRGRVGGVHPFVHFALEPLYKMYTSVLGAASSADLTAVAGLLSIPLSPADARSDLPDLLRLFGGRLFNETATTLVDLAVARVPAPTTAAATSRLCRVLRVGGVEKEETEEGEEGEVAPDEVWRALAAADVDGPLVLYVASVRAADRVIARVLSGRVTLDAALLVLRDSHEDTSLPAQAFVSALSLRHGAACAAVESAGPGQLVELRGVCASIDRSALLLDQAAPALARCRPCLPLPIPRLGVIRVAIEPMLPAQAGTLATALATVSQQYLAAATVTAESGEVSIFGPSELYLDFVLHDVRQVSAQEIRLSDPTARLLETVSSQSALAARGVSANGRNVITVVAEPMSEVLAAALEARAVGRNDTDRLHRTFGLDVVAARSVWTVGPPDALAALLLNDTLPTDTDPTRLATVRDAIEQGFQWAIREGPLTGECVRGVVVRLVDATISDDPTSRTPGQIIPAVRRAVHAALVTAAPRILEPLYDVEILTTVPHCRLLRGIVARRRGTVVGQQPQPGTPFVRLTAQLPVLDSFGFETDVRLATKGEAMPLATVAGWQMAPGDPLDDSVTLTLLEPSDSDALGRELMLKTRRRKGLDERIVMEDFVDPSQREELASLVESDDDDM
jgi:U5 small nuclear ribonucleoprotein component